MAAPVQERKRPYATGHTGTGALEAQRALASMEDLGVRSDEIGIARVPPGLLELHHTVLGFWRVDAGDGVQGENKRESHGPV